MKKIVLVVLSFMVIWLSACTPQQPVSQATNNGGNQQQTTIVIEGDNTGDITVNQGIVESNDNSNTAAATEAAPAAATDAPTVETDPAVCFYMAWHDGWTPKGPERIHTTGTINRAELENGISMQAPWDQWTTTTTVDGFTVPEGFETNNDAVMGVNCGDTAYIFDRDASSKMPFWKVSYIQLTNDGLLACENDVNTSNYGWSGNCDGDQVVVMGIPLDEVTVTDFQDDWDSLVALMNSWDGPTPEFGTIEEAWTSKK